MGYERYVDYALDVPMYFVYRDGRYIDAAGASFRDFMAGKLPQMPGELPTIDDWSDHLTTLFPEVRLKRFLEMRGADGGRCAPHRRPCRRSGSACSMTRPRSTAAWDLVKDWTAEERQALRDDVPRGSASRPRFRNGTRARHRPRSRPHLPRRPGRPRQPRCRGHATRRSTSQFVEEVVANGRTPADDLIARYRRPWNRDIDRVFTDAAF